MFTFFRICVKPNSTRIITARNEVGARLCFYRRSAILSHRGAVHDQVHPPSTPPDQVPPRYQVHPQTRYTPLGPGTPPRPGTPPQTRYPRGPGTPPGTRYTPLGPGTALRDQVHPWRTKYIPPGPGTPPGDQVHPLGPGTHPPVTRYPPD